MQPFLFFLTVIRIFAYLNHIKSSLVLKILLVIQLYNNDKSYVDFIMKLKLLAFCFRLIGQIKNVQFYVLNNPFHRLN